MFRLGRSKSYRVQARLSPARAMDARSVRQQVNRRTPAVKSPPPASIILGRGLIKRALGMAVFMAASGALLVGGYLSLSTSNNFLVRQVEVTGTELLGRFDVLQAAGIDTHTNLLTLSVRKARQGLYELPMVERASVERSLPGLVRIAVQERKAQWLAMVEGNLFLLDHQLKPFALARADMAADLPVVTGLTRADLVRPDEEVEALLEAAKRMQDSLPAGLAAAFGGLSEIHLDRNWGLSVVFNGLPPTVRLGVMGFEQRWVRLAKVLDDLKARGELARATLIDLDADRRVVVRLGRESA